MQGLLARLWDRLWFSRMPATDLAGMRVALGLLLLVWHVFLWPDLDLLTMDGPTDLRLLDNHWSSWRARWLDGWTTHELQGLHLVITGMILLYTVGFLTPVMGLGILLWLAAVWHRSPWTQNGGDRLLRIMLFYMMLAPTWRAWSLDRLWMKRIGWTPPTDAPVLAVRLVQLQLVVMYTYTGLAKTGVTWMEGSALYYSWLDVSYSRFPVLMDALMQSSLVRGLSAIGNYSTLVFEVGFLPLIAWRRTRYYTLAVGLFLHLGIWTTLSVGIFSWSSVWGYLALLDSGWAVRFRRLLTRHQAPTVEP